jgi:hypothetical protein
LRPISTNNPGGGLLVAALHAIYFNGRWHGGFPGEGPFYGNHIQAAIQLLRDDGYEYLSLSGGRTHPSVAAQAGGLSEAEGAKQYAVDQGLVSADDNRIILEMWARDSMENLYFSNPGVFPEDTPVALQSWRGFLGIERSAIPSHRMRNATGRQNLFLRRR